MASLQKKLIINHMTKNNIIGEN